MAASSWAEAAISWVEAEVSSVEAVTSSAEAEDCSATAATSPTSVWMRPVPSEMRSTASAISSTRAVTSTTAVSMLGERLAGLGDGAGARLGARRRRSRRRRRRGRSRAGSAPISVGDRAGGGLGALGELAHLVGDDGEAAALLAGARGLDGGVQRQQVRLGGERGDRLDDRLDLARAGGEVADRGGDLRARSAGRRTSRRRPPAR